MIPLHVRTRTLNGLFVRKAVQDARIYSGLTRVTRPHSQEHSRKSGRLQTGYVSKYSPNHASSEFKPTETEVSPSLSLSATRAPVSCSLRQPRRTQVHLNFRMCSCEDAEWKGLRTLFGNSRSQTGRESSTCIASAGSNVHARSRVTRRNIRR